MTERGRLVFGETPIECTVVRSRRRRKTVEITLDPTDGVVVAVPAEAPRERVNAIVAKRAPWIVRRAAEGFVVPPPKRFVSGESLPYLGREVRLFVEHADVKRVGLQFDHWSFRLTVPAALHGEVRREEIRAAFVRWYRRRAIHRLAARVGHWARLVGIAAPRVLIREQRQRWASCGPDDTLRFNWRIAMAPPALIDYVVAHELVHLTFKHHSADFWAQLTRLMPDCGLRRMRLKELGPRLAL